MGPGVPGLSGRAKPIDPRRRSRSGWVSRRVGAHEGEPLVLESLVFNSHPSHQLVDPVDSGSDNRGVAETANVPLGSVGGPG